MSSNVMPCSTARSWPPSWQPTRRDSKAAYDRYAPSLYAYCQSLLTEPADAADAVQDTFIIAAGKLSALRARDRLRPWLYAVARNECRRRLRSAGSAAPLDEAAAVTDDTTDLGADLEQAELREVVWSALAGLTPASGRSSS
jgi:RNA polymerase sigma factor (sigma-70 family)